MVAVLQGRWSDSSCLWGRLYEAAKRVPIVSLGVALSPMASGSARSRVPRALSHAHVEYHRVLPRRVPMVARCCVAPDPEFLIWICGSDALI